MPLPSADTTPPVTKIWRGVLDWFPGSRAEWFTTDFDTSSLAGPRTRSGGVPRVTVLRIVSVENGAEFLQAFYDAEAGKLDPFVVIVEGSIPNEKINGEGHWAGMGVNPSNGQPITTNEWIDRLAPKAAAVVAIGTCATYGGIPAMKNNPTGAMGLCGVAVAKMLRVPLLGTYHTDFPA